MKKYSSIIIALLGIIIGVFSVLVIQKAAHLSDYGSWRKLNLILQKVDAEYVDSVDHAKVSEAAISAALAALDPHSVYLPPITLEESEADLAGNFDGIGIQFNVPNDTAIVIEVIPGGPAEKIGLQPGDRILKVDDEVIAGVKFPQDSMVRRMKGPSGTKVTVTVGRGNEKVPFEITRGKIPTHSVDAAFMVNDSTGYIRFSKFSATAGMEFLTAGTQLFAQGMKELVLDIRDNSGGFLEQALVLANFFLPKGADIVYMEGLHCPRESHKADGRGPFKGIGLTLLIDEGSASSSEILAGALQDNGRATVVGRRSFGKGLVQKPIYFNDGSGVRLTIARYYTPSGRCIQKPYTEDYDYEVLKRYDEGEMVEADSMKIEKGGIIPDIFVPMDTTKVSQFYVACNRKATPMRFASAYFDSHKAELSAIDDYGRLQAYLDAAGLERQFLDFARRRDGISPAGSEWETERSYLMTQVRALVGRYSKLGDNAYYHIFLDIDETYKAAMQHIESK